VTVEKGPLRSERNFQSSKHDGINGFEYKKLPYIDQQETYCHVYDCLKDGGSIGIFPEGVVPVSSILMLFLITN
jgi:glycerol-3-phosphate O-acyltransferase/dihydroxyacetone phosphate acyltransferase